MIKIVVDLMGADKPLNELVQGPIKAINDNSDLSVVLCGPENEILNSIKDLSYNQNQLEIIDSKDIITNLDVPTRAFKSKPESSLIKGLNYCAENKSAHGFVSCGSTGAVLVSSQFILGKISECRPALASILLSQDGKEVCIVDCGANVDTKVEMLIGFAKMGVSYMEAIGVSNPRVSLLSNGSESKKGNELVKSAHEAFLNESFNFIGNIEGKEALSGNTDVIVCDGFVGNVLLKTIEGAAKTVFTDLVAKAKKSSDETTRNILLKSVNELMKKYDYNSLGGAVLLGVGKPVVKGHGAANSNTFYSIINHCYQMAKNNLSDKIINKMR